MSWQDQYDEKVRSEALEMAAKIAEEVAKETGDGIEVMSNGERK